MRTTVLLAFSGLVIAGHATAEEPTQVIVKGDKPAVVDKIDRRSYDMKDDPDANTGVAAKLLGKLPSVTVTADGKIALRGNFGVTIMVDGKVPPEGNDIIKSLPAADIDHIEIMTNPSAQYAPDGTAGIINIVTKKRHKVGYSGNLNGDIDSLGRGNLAMSGNVTTGRWTLGAGLSGGHYPSHGTRYDHQEVRDDLLAPFALQDQVTHFVVRSDNYQANLSAGYKLSDKGNLSLKTQYGDYEGGSDSTAEFRYGGDGDFDETFSSDFSNRYGNIDAIYDFTGEEHGRHFTLDLGHQFYDSISVTDYVDTPLAVTAAMISPYSRGVGSRGTDDSLKADYERSYDNNTLLTAGASLVRSVSRDVQDYAVAGYAISGSEFAGARDLVSAYVTYQMPVGKWTLLPGLRIEQQHLTLPGETTIDDVFLYPSLHLSRTLSDAAKIKLSYSRRVDRLGLNAYDGSLKYADARTAFAGNPDLKPVTTDSYEASWDYYDKDVSYDTTLYYKVASDNISVYSQRTSDGVLLTSLGNFGQSRSGGLELSLRGPLEIFNWKHTKYTLNGNAYYTEAPFLDGVEERIRGEVTGSANGTLEYDTDAGDQIQLHLSWYSRTPTYQGYFSGSYQVDLTWQHPLTKDLSIVLSADDLLNSTGTRNVIDTGVLRDISFSKPNSQAVKVALSYKFGQ